MRASAFKFIDVGRLHCVCSLVCISQFEEERVAGLGAQRSSHVDSRHAEVKQLDIKPAFWLYKLVRTNSMKAPLTLPMQMPNSGQPLAR
jgi:hypothetical protein